MGGTSFGRQFQVVFENSPIGIVIMDGTGRIQYANEAVRRFLRVDEEALVGGFLTSYAHREDSEFFQTLFGELLEAERDDFQVVARCRRADATEAWWRVDMRTVRPPDSSPFMLAVVDDVTSQKNDEAQLRRAKEMAEAATRTKSSFLANMSHEIRTPLHTINGMAELMKETELDEEQTEYLQQIQFASEVLLGLINDILDFSKIEAGRLQIESIAYDAVSTIEDAVEMVSLQAHRKGLEVVLRIDDQLPRTLIGDPNRLRQVVVNLVNNAVKFTSRGHIKVSAEVRTLHGDSRMLVQVRDTGIGIPEDRLDRLFKAFSQVDASMTRKFGGTGLGLSISRDLVEMMGGSIGVKSSEGKGSNFWFSLPFPESVAQRATVARPPSVPDSIRVLLVDDNRESAAVITEYLGRWGITPQNAPTGTAGLEAMRVQLGRSAPYDVVFADLMLPDMDGWQFASEIRNDALLEKTRLILMSPLGLSSGEAKMKLLRWFDAYINKPVTTVRLGAALERIYSADIEELEAVDGDAHAGDPGASLGGELPKTVLVAEDHFVNQQLFQTILEKKGFRTLVANDGAEAVEMIQANPEVGIIFMDVQMPNLNGYDATTRIRELGIETPIIAVTANALSGDRDRCVRVGMNEYMTKPFKSADIDAVLGRLVTAGYFAVRPGSVAQSDSTVTELPPSEPADTVDEDPLDVENAVEAFMGDRVTAIRVVQQFADRLPEQIDALAEQLSAGAAKEARVASHAIKGGAWNLGAGPLGAVAKEIEDACAAEELARAKTHMAVLRREAERFRTFVVNL